VTTVLAVASLLVATGTSAHAGEPTAGVDETAALIRTVAPEPIDVVAPQAVADDGALVVETDHLEALLPADGSGDVLITPEQGQSVSIALPREAGVAEAQIADDGTVVYAGPGPVDVAVQVDEDGFRTQTVLADASAPTSYTYTFDGLTPVLQEDGGVVLDTELGGASVTVATVAQPWAVDATGRSVPTRYRVEGSALIQEVDHRAPDLTYPVVADPWVSFGRYVYVNYTRADVRRIAPYAWTWRLGSVACAAIPNLYAAAACAIAMDQHYSGLSSTFSAAARANQCVQLRFTYPAAMVLVGYSRYAC
jgi:hypothetical protein